MPRKQPEGRRCRSSVRAGAELVSDGPTSPTARSFSITHMSPPAPPHLLLHRPWPPHGEHMPPLRRLRRVTTSQTSYVHIQLACSTPFKAATLFSSNCLVTANSGPASPGSAQICSDLARQCFFSRSLFDFNRSVKPAVRNKSTKNYLSM
jgi:hypothetical protein